MNDVMHHFEKSWDSHLEDLKSLVRIPGVSFEGFPAQEVVRSAEAVASLLKKRGFENVEILRLEGAHPYVYGEWLHASGKPTLLLYAHHDVQPPGRQDAWQTPPFDPVEKEGPGGKRLYGRGAADDKAGVIVHTAAVSAFLEKAGQLPVNVKILVEGEEETGSAHLGEFLQKHREKLQADILVLTDTMNFDCGIPALTVALRGMVGVEVELRALEKTVHSGMWGGPLPDPAMALCKLLAKLVDDQGRIAIPGIEEQLPSLREDEEAQYARLPFDDGRFREQSGLLDHVQILRRGPSPLAQIWRYPSLSVNAIQASQRGSAGNIINDAAWARVTIRLAPGMDSAKTLKLLEDFLRSQCPWGLEVGLKAEEPASPWATDPTSESNRAAFEAAQRALKQGYGKDPVLIGCGGTIPFVQPFAEALGGAPALLIGVEDPFTNAHGENESVLLEDLKKACLSQILLFSEFAAQGK